MGKREELDARKALRGEFLCGKSRPTFKDFLLTPFRAWKQKRREAKIRKNLFKNLGE